MLPLKEHLTRWYITIRHNYMTNLFGKKLMIEATKYILNQDKKQFERQIKNNKLKNFITWKKNLKYENHMKTIRDYYSTYNYPLLEDFIEELSKNNW